MARRVTGRTVSVWLNRKLESRVIAFWHSQRLGTQAEGIRELLRLGLEAARVGVDEFGDVCVFEAPAREEEAEVSLPDWIVRSRVAAEAIVTAEDYDRRGVSLPRVVATVIDAHTLSDLVYVSRHLRSLGWKKRQSREPGTGVRQVRFFPPVTLKNVRFQ